MDLGSILSDGQLLFALLIALAAGLVSFASPCVLPLVPGYLAYIGSLAGVDPDGVIAAEKRSSQAANRRARNRLVLGVSLFIVGFSTVFILFMTLGSTVGVWLATYQDLISRVMGAIVIVMGLVFVGLFRPLQQTKKLSLTPKVGLVGAPVLGAGFAIGWTPCIGPTLAMILSLSVSMQPDTNSIWRGALLGVAYCAGLGLPFVLVAIGFGWMTQTTAFMRRNIRTINIVSGAVLIAIGILMVTGIWTQLMSYLQAVTSTYVIPL